LRLPGQRRQQRVPGQVSQIDVVPTLLDYLGRAPAELPGQSLRDQIERGAPPRDVFIEWNALAGEQARTVLTPDGWKLTLSTEGRHELRQLNADPVETGNLFRKLPATVTELGARLRAWQERVGDALVLGHA
jgi:arylsulfatase A-like enzyme